MNLNDFAARYVERRASLKNLKPSTKTTYVDLLKYLNMPAAPIGAIALADLTLDNIEDLVMAMQAQKLSTTRINMVLVLVNSVLADAHSRQKIAHPIHAETVGGSSNDEKKEMLDPFTEAEITKIIAASSAAHRALFTALAFTGARPCEITALKWKHVNIDDRTITIDCALVRGSEGKTKTGNKRVIPMLPQVETVILNMDPKGADDYVFVNRNGAPFDYHINDVWQSACARAGIEPRPVYQCRHSFALNSLKKGVPLPLVSRLLGHKSLTVTINNYLKNVRVTSDDLDTVQELWSA